MKKIISILLIILIFSSITNNYVMALEIDNAQIKAGEDCRISSSILA